MGSYEPSTTPAREQFGRHGGVVVDALADERVQPHGQAANHATAEPALGRCADPDDDLTVDLGGLPRPDDDEAAGRQLTRRGEVVE